MKDTFVIIFILIFVVIPLIKKIFESLGGQGGQQVRRRGGSAQEVKDYLEKMRSSKPNSAQRGYRAPASTQGQRHYRYGTKRDQMIPGAPGVDIESEALLDLQNDKQDQPRFKSQIQEPSVVSTDEIEQDEAQAKTPVAIKKIMDDQRFNDVQKAIIFAEIFAKPKFIQRDS